MRIVGVRSTATDDGLVAVLLEEGGPGMIAVPVTAREGLALSGMAQGMPPSWLDLLHRCLTAVRAQVIGGLVEVGPDGELLASLELTAGDGQAPLVHCTPGEAIVFASQTELGIRVSDRLLAQQGVDLGEPSVHETVARMRDQLQGARVDDFLP
nr:DUF151 domain-containing protein [Actinomyces weissii]